MRLMLRTLVQAQGIARAQVEQAALLWALAPFAPQPLHAPEPYPKLPDTWECAFELHQARFEDLTALCGEGWWHGGDETDRSSVWNAAPGRALLTPAVRWAELLTTA